MLPEREVPALERLRFFDGLLLTAQDLESEERYHRELRWLHNRALHGWGVVSGLEVEGEEDARSVSLRPGTAQDCAGRELILPEPVSGAVPPLSGPAELYLTVSYAEDEELAAQTRDGACGASGVVRRAERPNIRWISPAEFAEGADIVVASAKIRNCRLAERVSSGPRQELPRQLPYLATGATESGATHWYPWPGQSDPAGVATTVGTGSAGFSRVPHYEAEVIGPREFLDQGVTSAVDGYVHIAKRTATSFELRMLLPGPLQTSPTGRMLNPAAVRQPGFGEALRTDLAWYVSWMGVEL